MSGWGRRLTRVAGRRFTSRQRGYVTPARGHAFSVFSSLAAGHWDRIIHVSHSHASPRLVIIDDLLCSLDIFAQLRGWVLFLWGWKWNGRILVSSLRSCTNAQFSVLALLPNAAPSLTTSFRGQRPGDGASGWQIMAEPADWLSDGFLADWLSVQLIN